MNLTYLKAFYTTINCNSISKAAAELHLTQPGLSRQLKSLEAEIGVTLLSRSNTGVKLTEAGKILYESAGSMLLLESNILKNLEKLKNENNKLDILCCNSIGQNILPCSIYTFKEIHPNININMELDNHSNIVNKLITHSRNVAVVQNIALPDTLHTINILPDELILVSGDLSVPDSITMEEFLTYPLILNEKDSGIFKILSNELNKHSINTDNLNIFFSLNSIQSTKSTLMVNNSYSILPESAVRHELRKGILKKVNITNFKFTFDYCIACRKDYVFTKNEEKLIKFLTSKKRCFCY